MNDARDPELLGLSIWATKRDRGCSILEAADSQEILHRAAPPGLRALDAAPGPPSENRPQEPAYGSELDANGDHILP